MIVYVTHVDDSITGRQGPCLYFWGQKNRSLYIQIENYLKSLAPILHSSSPLKNLCGLDEQKLCALIDGKWLRIKITEPLKFDAGCIEVFCLDLGEVKCINFGFIRSIPKVPGSKESEFGCDFKDVEPLADKFILADVIPSRGQWTESAMIFLKENVVNYFWKAVSLGVFSGYHGVRLYNQSQVLLATTMIERNFGLPTQTYKLTPSTGTDVQSYLHMSPLFSSSTSTATERSISHRVPSFPPLIMTPPTSLPIVPSFASARFPPPFYKDCSRDLPPFKRPAFCNPLISNKSQRAYVASEIRTGVIQEVVVTNVENGFQRFTVQLKDAQYGLDLLRAKIDSLELKPMKEHARGAPCIAIYSQDQQPHRGLITVVEDLSCKIYYIDYGNSESLDKHSIYEIPDELVRIKLYACRVSLADTEELDQFNTETVSDIFSVLVLGKQFQCQTVGDEIFQKVTLHNASGFNMRDVLISQCMFQTAIGSHQSPTSLLVSDGHLNRPKAAVVPTVRSVLTRTTLKVFAFLFIPILTITNK